MTTLTLVFLAAALAHAAALALRIPPLPLLVSAGILLRLTGAAQDADTLQSMLVLGVTVLVFLTGTELNPRRFARQGKAVLTVGLTQVTVLGSAGLGIGLAWDLSAHASAYLALALGASSTFVVVRILKRRRQFHEPFARLVLGVLLLQDVAVVLGASALLAWDGGLQAVESALLRTSLLLFCAWLCARSVVPWLLTRLKLDDEAILIVVLGLLFTFIGGAQVLGIPLIAGAFAAGFAVSSFPVNAVIRGQLTSLSDFFVAVFLTALGAVLTLPTWDEFLLAGTLVGTVLLLTPPLVLWAARRAGMTVRAALEGGLLLAQTSELSLVVLLLGTERAHVDSGLLGATALVTVTTMLLTQFLATDSNTFRLMRLYPSRFRADPSAHHRAGHIVVLGCGTNSEPLVRELIATGDPVIVIDDEPTVDRWVHEAGGIPIRGDAADPDVMRRASVASARVVISTLRRIADNRRVIALANHTPVLVRVFDDEDAALISQAGGVPVRYSDAAADVFLAWFDAQRPAASATPTTEAPPGPPAIAAPPAHAIPASPARGPSDLGPPS